MTLVDTSAWIDHFRRSDASLVRKLDEGAIVCHSFVIGELALGHLANRDEILELLEALPALAVVAHEDVLAFVARHRLAGSGIGWVDAHLLAAVASAGADVLTHDARLRRQAARLDLAAQ